MTNDHTITNVDCAQLRAAVTAAKRALTPTGWNQDRVIGLTGSSHGLTVSGTDGETSVQVRCDGVGTIIDTPTVHVDETLLASALKAIPKGKSATVTITVDRTANVVVLGDAGMAVPISLKTDGNQDHRPVPEFGNLLKGRALLSIEQWDAIRLGVAPAAGIEDHRPILQAVCFTGRDAVATDSYMLACVPDCGVNVGTEEDQLVPAVVFTKLAPHVKTLSSDGGVEIRFSDNTFEARTGRWTVRTNLIIGAFPKWRTLLPLPKDAELKNVKLATAAAKPFAVLDAIPKSDPPACRVYAEDGGTGLRVVDGETSMAVTVGTVSEKVVANATAEDKVFGINPKFLSKFLGMAASPGPVKGVGVDLGWVDDLKPLHATGSNGTGWYGILMPTRMS